MAEVTLSGQYDWKLVALSIVIAFCASYLTLELAGRSAGSPLRRKNFWVGSGAVSMGVGLWGMHAVALLSAQLPVSAFKDLSSAVFSLSGACACALAAFLLVGWRPVPERHLLMSSLVLSGCMSAMLSAAFDGLELATGPASIFGLMGVSLAIAAASCTAAFQIGFHARASTNQMRTQLACGAVMAFAVAGIQYAGIRAANYQAVIFSAAGGHPGFTQAQSFAVGEKAASEVTVWVAALLLGVLALSLLLADADRVLMARHGLRSSEQERWHLVMSANQDGLFDFNMSTGEVFYSDRWKEILGYGPDELDNMLETWQHRIHPDDKKQVDAEIEAYLRAREGTAELEYRLRHRDGTWRWILSRSQGIWNDKGQAVRLVGTNCDITDRKRTLEALSASEARFRAFMEHSPNIAFIKDSGGKFIYTNPMHEHIWKLKPGGWIGKSNGQIWPDAVATRVDQSDREVLSAHVRSEMIEEFEMPDGTTRQFLTSKFSFPDAAGNRLIGGVSLDVSERMQIEEQLRNAELRYRELFEHNPLPSWIYRTRDLRILNVNQAAIDHYGWSRAQFMNLTILSLHPPEAASAAESELMQPSQKYQRTQPIRHRRYRKSDIWVELSIHEFDAAGNTCRLVMANDVTLRLLPEVSANPGYGYLETLAAQRAAELQPSEARWRGLVEALPQIIWSARPDGFCDYISQRLADYTGVPVSDLAGWGWLGFVHPADREPLRAHWRNAVNTSGSYQVEYRIRSKEGGYRWFLTSGRCVKAGADNTGETQWLGTTSDIEDQKRSLLQLQAAVAERRSMVAEVPDATENKAKEKSELLACMSHEIRIPLNGVIGMTSLVLNTPLNSKQRAYIDIIRSCGEALLKITNDVLDFSQLDAGNLDLENAEFDLPALVEASMETLAAPAAAKGIHLSLNIAEDVPFNAASDAARLRQILLHLLSNAIKFTNLGSISLSVSQEAPSDSVSETAAVVCFNVCDTGIGLTPDEQTALFQPFGHATGSNNRRFGGTGLGLSIAKRLVQLMGGSIGVSSERGKGSTFWFRLPMTAVPDQAALDFQAFSDCRILLLASGGGPLNGYQSAMVRRYLERAGFALVVSDWPPPGDSAENSGHFDHLPPISLVIADGNDVKEIFDDGSSHRLPMLDRCPALILGSPADFSNVRLLPPQVAYVAKPVQYLALLSVVRRLLSGGAAEGAEQGIHRLDRRDENSLAVANNGSEVRDHQLISG